MSIEVGKSVDSHGKRLFFCDLKIGDIVLADYSTESITDYRVCKVIDLYETLDGNCADLDDGDYAPSLGYASFSEKELSGMEKREWLFEIPENYKEV